MKILFIYHLNPKTYLTQMLYISLKLTVLPGKSRMGMSGLGYLTY